MWLRVVNTHLEDSSLILSACAVRAQTTEISPTPFQDHHEDMSHVQNKVHFQSESASPGGSLQQVGGAKGPTEQAKDVAGAGCDRGGTGAGSIPGDRGSPVLSEPEVSPQRHRQQLAASSAAASLLLDAFSAGIDVTPPLLPFDRSGAGFGSGSGSEFGIPSQALSWPFAGLSEEGAYWDHALNSNRPEDPTADHVPDDLVPEKGNLHDGLASSMAIGASFDYLGASSVDQAAAASLLAEAEALANSPSAPVATLVLGGVDIGDWLRSEEMEMVVGSLNEAQFSGPGPSGGTTSHEEVTTCIIPPPSVAREVTPPSDTVTLQPDSISDVSVRPQEPGSDPPRSPSSAAVTLHPGSTLPPGGPLPVEGPQSPPLSPTCELTDLVLQLELLAVARDHHNASLLSR